MTLPVALSRRGFLAGAAALSAGPALAQPAGASIDTHAHIFERGQKLADVRRYAPDYDAKVGDYLAQLDANGMTHGVLVQPSFFGTDNSYLLAGLGPNRARLRGIAVVDPAIAPAELKTMDAAGVVGIRLNLVGLAIPDFSAAPWPALLKTVADLGWQVEVQRRAADLPAIIGALTQAGVTVVIDHFGLPDREKGVEDPDYRAFLATAATRKVWVKVSGYYRAGGEAIATAAYPKLRDAFGLDRLVWGSDWPHTQNETTQTFAKNKAFFETLVTAPAERAAILGANAKALFKI